MRSKLTLVWGPMLAWKGYSAGRARIREVDSGLAPPRAAAPVPSSAAATDQESQRLPWLPDCAAPNKRQSTREASAEAGTGQPASAWAEPNIFNDLETRVPEEK